MSTQSYDIFFEKVVNVDALPYSYTAYAVSLEVLFLLNQEVQSCCLDRLTESGLESSRFQQEI